MSREPRATADFETKSEAKLGKEKGSVGAWMYSRHPSTRVMCLAFRLPHWPAGKTGLWYPGIDYNVADIFEFQEWIEDGKPVEAHNAFFERCIWRNVLLRDHPGWPAVQSHQWRCSAAKAAACALPRGLDDALAALDLPIRKDAEGHAVMMKLSKPRKPVKADGEGPHGTLWYDDPKLFERLYAYCRQDVLAEEALSEALPDLSEAEQAVYQLDQEMNERGFCVDTDAVDTALGLIRRESLRLNGELRQLTEGRVTAATQRAQLMAWLKTEEGLDLEDTTKETVTAALQNAGLSDRARRVLSILAALGRSSTAKYEAMQRWADTDGRVRGSLIYHGATTGRWSGAGVQPHNFPRGNVADQHIHWAGLKYGWAGDTAIQALSDGLRGTIIASPGHRLYVADYANIEARVLLWLAGDEEHLDLYRKGEDVYCTFASTVFGRPITKADKRERLLGKTAVLGLGYGMGPVKFLATAKAAGLDITADFAQQVVRTYRDEFKAVRYFWYRQEDAAVGATLGNPYTQDGLRWAMCGRFLTVTLPSGRRLYYPDPKVTKREDATWMSDQLTCKGTSIYAHQWTDQKLYGGKLVENIVQAVSRDILADAILGLAYHGPYTPILTVHDEVIAEAPEGQGSLEGFEALMLCQPAWSAGLPIAIEAFTDTRYRK